MKGRRCSRPLVQFLEFTSKDVIQSELACKLFGDVEMVSALCV